MDAQTKLRLDRINQKGWEVATKLSELLAGKDIDLSKFHLTGLDDSEVDKMKKEAALRAFLDQINGARKRLLEEDDAYGKCVTCGTVFTAPMLDELPWIERCNDCLAKGAAAG